MKMSNLRRVDVFSIWPPWLIEIFFNHIVYIRCIVYIISVGVVFQTHLNSSNNTIHVLYLIGTLLMIRITNALSL